jgi:hypothetical protein
LFAVYATADPFTFVINAEIVYTIFLIRCTPSWFVLKAIRSYMIFSLVVMYRWLVESFSTHGMHIIVQLGASPSMTICLFQDQKMGALEFGISSRKLVFVLT